MLPPKLLFLKGCVCMCVHVCIPNTQETLHLTMSDRWEVAAPVQV